MLRSAHCSDIGLFKGKMGVVILFYHLYRQYSNPIYERYADFLLDNIFEKITKSADISFGQGLCGIGWAIEYLLQNGFAEGSGAEICQEIDRRIMMTDPRRIVDLTVENGLHGLVHYAKAHIKHNKNAFDTIFIDDLQNIIKQKLYHTCDLALESRDYVMSVKQFIEKPQLQEDKIATMPIGIQSGLGGYLLYNIL